MHQSIAILLLFLVCAMSKGQPVRAKGLENGFPKGYVCRRAASPIVIDGKLDDPVWKQAPRTDFFVDIEGTLKPPPKYRTEVKMLWDDKYLYIGALLADPHVWATFTKRDTVIFYDNDFEVFIDPNGDNHEYFESEMNAFNTSWDLFLAIPYRDGGKANVKWDIVGLKTAVYVDGTINDCRDTDRGWSAELAIPWDALRAHAHMPCPPREGDQWRINFSRVEWDVEIVEGRYQKIKDRPENNWVWSPQWAIDMHRPELWGYVQFSATKATKFLPDPSLPARATLMKVYYSQKKFREKGNRWGDSLEQLGLGNVVLPKGVTGLQLSTRDSVWTAEVHYAGDVWRVRDDSKLDRTDEKHRKEGTHSQ